jgi:DNA-binding beta-propeller fold protein YncE
VVDVKQNKVLGSVDGLIGIKAIALTQDPKVVYTSDADGSVAVIDVPGLKVTKKLDVGGTPDAADFDSVHNLIAVSLSKDKAVALIDPTAQKVIGRVPLPGDPELFAVDQQAGRIFLAIHSLDEVVQIDPTTQSISTTYKGCGFKAPTGLAYDADQGRLFVSNTGATLSIVDVVVDRCLGSVDIGHGTDQITFNSHTHHVYTADGGSRYVSVIDSVSMKPLGLTGTGPSASTIATDPTTDLVYVAVKRSGIIAVYHDP